MTSPKKHDEVVRIDHLPLAAAIMASNIALADVDNTAANGRYMFLFTDPAAADIARDFTTGTLEVNARLFMYAFDQLRNLSKGRVGVDEVAK